MLTSAASTTYTLEFFNNPSGTSQGQTRYNLDGTLDRTFGGSGEVLAGLGRALAVRVQTDGKVLAAGYAFGSSWESFEVVRFNPDGTLDASFGSNGKVITGFSRGSNAVPAEVGGVSVSSTGNLRYVL
jgi:uncharacterized delta-60 repeat protein